MAAKRSKRSGKRGSGATKGRAKPGSRNARSRKRAKKRTAARKAKKKQRIREVSTPRFIPIVPQVSGARVDDKPRRKTDSRVRPSESVSEDVTAEFPQDYDEEDIEEYADLWGVSYEEAEAVLEESTDVFANVPLDDYGRPDIDYMSELADMFDVEVSDLYDLYYGCTPGSSE